MNLSSCIEKAKIQTHHVKNRTRLELTH